MTQLAPPDSIGRRSLSLGNMPVTDSKAAAANGSAPGEEGVSHRGVGNLPPLASLKCCLCSDYLKAPVTLACLHTGCHGCFLKHAGPFSPVPEGTTRAIPPAIFPCPVCHEDASVPRDPAQVSTDSRTQRLISLIQETHQLCDNCGEIAEVACNVCTSSMCSGCFSTTHAAPVFKSHKGMPLQSAKLAQLSSCSVHGSELEFWCDKCHTGVCQVCLLKGSHKGHSYTPVRDVRNSSYTSIKESLKAAIAFKKEMESAMEMIDGEMQTLKTQYDQVCSEINSNFDNLVAAIDERKSALLKDAADLRNSKEKSLSEQKASFDKAAQDVTDAIDRTSSLITYSNDLEIVERQSLVEARLKKMTLKALSKAPSETGTLAVALFNHINAAVAGYGAVRGTAPAAAAAHKHQLEKLVSEADRILANKTPQQAMPPQAVDGSVNISEQMANVNDGSYCTIM